MLDPTPLFRRYARRRIRQLEGIEPAAAQRRLLADLLRTAAQTRFGSAHDFSGIATVDDYQRAVPLRTYEDFWHEFWEAPFPTLEDCTWPGRIPYFALTSGTTTGSTKYIPFTMAMMRANSRAGLDLLAWHVTRRPESSICRGKSFMLGGSSELTELAPGIFAGDLSGIVVNNLPLWVRPWSFPPRRIALMKDWEQKIELLAGQALEQRITSISGVPSWLTLLLAKMAELKNLPAIDIGTLLPDLQLLIHGGVNFAPYQGQYESFLAASRAEMREVYPASEGFIALADRGTGQGLRLLVGHGLFYEFVPVEELGAAEPARHWAGTIETGVNYALALSSAAGLWSYLVGDTVRFVDRDPPRLLVTGRLSYSLSAFGEHLIGAEIETAVAAAAAAIGRSVSDFSVGAEIPEDPRQPGCHRYLIEFSGEAIGEEERTEFTRLLDEELRRQNEDYDAHRADGYGLSQPEVVAVRPGAFAAWMKHSGKLGGQHKVPRVIQDQELFASLREFVSRPG